MTALGNPITNDFECPLLTLTDTVLLVPPHRVQTSVSIIHQCADTCTFTGAGIRHRIEREEVHVHCCNLLYKHDWSNNLYCLNIFCMNQWYSFFLYTCIVPTASDFNEFSSHVIQFRSMAQVIQNALTQLYSIDMLGCDWLSCCSWLIAAHNVWTHQVKMEIRALSNFHDCSRLRDD